MAFSIKNDDTDDLLRRLVAVTGESLTEAVTVSVRERLERLEHTQSEFRLRRILDCADAARRLPVLTVVGADEILGYDDDGLPT